MMSNLGKFVSVTDYEKLKELFRASRAFRDACDEESGKGPVQAFLLQHLPKEWQRFRAVVLDIELSAERALSKE